MSEKPNFPTLTDVRYRQVMRTLLQRAIKYMPIPDDLIQLEDYKRRIKTLKDRIKGFA